ncbi:MAG TPA: Asp-tRNA(Asn)/Glu-tRNA(Gln) amidotransferase subunit GatC [Bacilli bacterium]|nr:Asp-tRNA(Asn)/Glu-tRNA(Gln) amidotransferase subunit GatC [Bacilli bacterium]
MAHMSKEQLKHVAQLARIAVTEEETELFAGQIDGVLAYCDILNEVNTDNVEPTTHVVNISNVLREDVVKESLTQEDALKNAPEQLDGQVKVPSIME